MAEKILKTLKFGDGEDTYVLSPDWKNVHNKPDYDKIIDIERKRINSFLALPEGSTTGDAVLADMCIGHNGKVYSSAGEALRGQIKDVYFSLQGKYELDVGLKFEDYEPTFGKVYINGGKAYTNTDDKYLYNKTLIPVSKGMVIRSDVTCRITGFAAFDENESFLVEHSILAASSSTSATNVCNIINVDWDGYIQVAFSTTTISSSLTTEEFNKIVSGVKIYMPMDENTGIEYLSKIVAECEDKVNEIHNDGMGMYDKEVVKFSDYEPTSGAIYYNGSAATTPSTEYASSSDLVVNKILIPVSKGMIITGGKRAGINGFAAYDTDGNFLKDKSDLRINKSGFDRQAFFGYVEVDWDGYIQFSAGTLHTGGYNILFDEIVAGVKITKPSNINDELNDLLQRVAALEK